MALRMCLVGFALVTLRLIIGGGLSPSVCELAKTSTDHDHCHHCLHSHRVCVYVNGDPSSSFFGTQPQLLPTVLLAILMLLRLLPIPVLFLLPSPLPLPAPLPVLLQLSPSPRCCHHRPAAIAAIAAVVIIVVSITAPQLSPAPHCRPTLPAA